MPFCLFIDCLHSWRSMIVFWLESEIAATFNQCLLLILLYRRRCFNSICYCLFAIFTLYVYVMMITILNCLQLLPNLRFNYDIQNFWILLDRVRFIIFVENMIILRHKFILIRVIKSRTFYLIYLGISIVYSITQICFVVNTLKRIFSIERWMPSCHNIWAVFTANQAWTLIKIRWRFLFYLCIVVI